MRRVAGSVLIGVGIFAVVMALLLPTVVLSGSKKLPLNLNVLLRSTGQAQVLDATSGQLTTVDLRATRYVQSDSKASDSTNTTMNETLCIVIVNGTTPDCFQQAPSDANRDPRLLSTTTDRVIVNRKTAEAVSVAKYGEAVNGKAAVHVGLDYTFPIGTKKQTYQFYQPDVQKAFPALYVGTEKLKGLTVYKFVCDTGDQPYKINGTFDGTYNDTRTVWVEPKTGAIIKGTESQTQTITGGTVALKITQPLTFDNKAQTDQANYAKTKIRALDMAQLWGPLVCALIALLALGAGLYLLRAPGQGGGSGGDGGQRNKHVPPSPHPENVGDPSDLLHHV